MKEFLLDIQNSFKLLDLKKSWDDEGAEPANLKAYCRSLEFLIILLNKSDKIISPDISLCPDGTIDITFTSEKYNLLINVREKSMAWYGYGKFEDAEIKGESKIIFNQELFDYAKFFIK